MEKFKVGDKVAIIGKISSKNSSITDYPFNFKSNGSDEEIGITDDGKFYDSDTEQNVFLLSDLTKSEYPKEMYVSDEPITKTNKGVKRTVIGKYDRFVAIDNNKKDLCVWKYATDIEPEQTKEQRMDEIEVLIEKGRSLVNDMQKIIDALSTIKSN
jgi:hypothetical protein